MGKSFNGRRYRSLCNLQGMDGGIKTLPTTFVIMVHGARLDTQTMRRLEESTK